MPDRRIVLLAGPGPSSNIVYHAITKRFGDIAVVMESPVSRRKLLLRRWQVLGAFRVAGQILFMAGFYPLLRRRATARIQEIKREYGLCDDIIPEPVIHVKSVNASETREILGRLNPEVVVVNGTRIISEECFRAVPASFINMHAGITPAYRGVHGGYWALYEGNPALVGTTIHLIDEGIDTGGVLGQEIFTTTASDSFATYPYLHVAAGLPVLLEKISEALDGSVKTASSTPNQTSRLRTHPTVWEYVYGRLRKGVR